MNPTLYEKDYYLWLEETVQLLKDRRLSELDINNLLEEIEDISISQKDALESNLIMLLMHLLKWKYQPEKQSGICQLSIRENRRKILKSLKQSPSFNRYLIEIFPECYQEARGDAAAETELSLMIFPVKCPFTIENVLNPNYLPNIDE